MDTTPDLNTSGGGGDVSRSGRVRKKSSKLADFQSPDEVEQRNFNSRQTPSAGSGSGSGSAGRSARVAHHQV